MFGYGGDARPGDTGTRHPDRGGRNDRCRHGRSDHRCHLGHAGGDDRVGRADERSAE